MTPQPIYQPARASSLQSANTQALGAVDNAGKVVFAAPNAAGLTTAYIYIAHQ
jgi:hypothetical protein